MRVEAATVHFGRSYAPSSGSSPFAFMTRVWGRSICSHETVRRILTVRRFGQRVSQAVLVALGHVHDAAFADDAVVGIRDDDLDGRTRIAVRSRPAIEPMQL